MRIHVWYSKGDKTTSCMQHTVNNVAPSQVSIIRYLGILISSNLSWNAFVDFANRKAPQILGFLK